MIKKLKLTHLTAVYQLEPLNPSHHAFLRPKCQEEDVARLPGDEIPGFDLLNKINTPCMLGSWTVVNWITVRRDRIQHEAKKSV